MRLAVPCRGACYYNTANNNCPTGGVLSTATRNANIKQFVNAITGAVLAWLYWQVLPNADPHVRLLSLNYSNCVAHAHCGGFTARI